LTGQGEDLLHLALDDREQGQIVVGLEDLDGDRAVGGVAVRVLLDLQRGDRDGLAVVQHAGDDTDDHLRLLVRGLRDQAAVGVALLELRHAGDGGAVLDQSAGLHGSLSLLSMYCGGWWWLRGRRRARPGRSR